MTLYNTERKNPSRRHKHYKHICTQHRSTRIYKENFGGLQERYRLATHIYKGIFKTPLSTMDRSSKQNINKDIVALNYSLNQMDLIDIQRTFPPKEAKYAFFSNAHEIFSNIDHMVGYTSINKFKKIEIISSIFSQHKGLKVETNLKKKLKNTQIHGD